ncbi:ABC-type glycerol-3-phosphate transport system, substrate-binding protein [Amphibacillus marinus]|uniref:ABC-type glycerol-3-phosphate transport system, substrate-binding protein n=1 Tax=Amphibacillus marinus TaxID=872970 RepID=A0A1H8MLD5_9BACI|nr:extracellular solute-binding protein [Amphibacillus marinus]SEO18119.1 ABC-type glycerol-3-phosphate transport system, substrate-binding protein [Amphibacillus marinus]
MKNLQFSMLAFFLIIALVGLVACGGNDEPSANEGDPEQEQEVDNEGEEEPAVEEESYDLGGRVIRIAQHWDMTPEGGTEIGDLTVERWHEVEEKYNVKIEWVVVPWEEKVDQLTSTILAGEPFADIVGLDANQVAPLIQQDYVYALDELIDLNESQLSQALQDIYTISGNVYMFGHQVNQSGGMYYNKTMFDQAGLPDPFELQQAGDWTWDAMLEAAIRLTDGTTYGLSADPSMLGEYLVVTNGGQYLDETTGQVTIDSANAIEAYEFMSALYNENRVIKENEGNNWEDPRRYFTEGLVGMTQGFVWEAEGRAETPFEWGYVFWPKGPQVEDYKTPVNNVEGLVIPKGVEDADIVYKIWEDMQVWEYSGEDVVEWFEMVMPSLEAVDTATLMLNQIAANYWGAYGISDAFYEMHDNIASGAESPSQAVTSVIGEAQSLVDAFTGN